MRITIQTPTKTETEIGGLINTWVTLFSSWANVAPIRGMKLLHYGQSRYTDLYEVELRARGINPDYDCQVVYCNGNYAILSLIITITTVKMDIGRIAV